MLSTAACPSGATWLLLVIGASLAMGASSLPRVIVPCGLRALEPEPHAHLAEKAHGRLEVRTRGPRLAQAVMDRPQPEVTAGRRRPHAQALASGERLTVHPKRLARLRAHARDVAEEGPRLSLVALLAEPLGEVERLAGEGMRLLDPSAEEEALRAARQERGAMALDAELLEEAESALKIAQRLLVRVAEPRAHQPAEGERLREPDGNGPRLADLDGMLAERKGALELAPEGELAGAEARQHGLGERIQIGRLAGGIAVDVGALELAQVGEAEGEPAAAPRVDGHVHAWNVLGDGSIRAVHDAHEGLDGCAIVADSQVEHGEGVLRGETEGNVADLLGDGQRALGLRHALTIAAGKPGIGCEPLGDPAQSALIAQLSRERLRLELQLHEARDPALERHGHAEIEPHVDGPPQRIRTRRQPGQELERLLEALPALRDGPACADLAPCLAEIVHGLVPDAPAHGVMREQLDGGDGGALLEVLHRLDYRGMERGLSLVEEATVGNLVSEGVLEGVLGARERARLIEELRAAEPHESLAQLAFGHFGDGAQQGHRHVLAEHGGGLEQPLVLGEETVDARGEDGLHGGRHLNGVDGLLQAIAPTAAQEGFGFHECADALFEEERIALRALDEHVLERGQIRIVAEEIDEQMTRALHGQRIDAELPIIGLAAPAVVVLGAIARDDEEGRGGQAVDEALEERLRLALAQEQVSHALQRPLPSTRWIETLPGRIRNGCAEEGEERGQRGLQ